MAKQIDAKQAVEMVKDGMTVMIGGFLSNGTPEILVDALIEKGVKDLTVIANDTGLQGTGISKLVAAGALKKVIVSHIGTNPQTGTMMNEGTLEVDLVPQGTLAERVRAGGSGLGGVLTKTGLGTLVAQGKQTVTIDGEEYLLEKPLHADVALIRGSIVDERGNVFYKGTTRNFNSLMAMAADTVIVATPKIVSAGEIANENVVTPAIFVDYIVGGEQE